MNATLNGHARKTLAQQLDRMDSMLDGLAEGLNDAVATAATAGLKDVVCVAVQQAVRTTLTELLSNPQVRNRLAPERPSASWDIIAVAKAGWNWLASVGRRVWRASISYGGPTLQTAGEASIHVLASAKEKAIEGCSHLASTARRGWMLASVLTAVAKRYRFHVAVAILVGTAFGLVGWWGGRALAAVGCGLSGFVGSLASVAAKQSGRANAYLTKFTPNGV